MTTTSKVNNKPIKLPFEIQLNRKYNEINADYFVSDWTEHQDERRERTISMCNDLHIELGKFSTFEIKLDEIIDLGLRYALSKREFRSMIAKVIISKGNCLNI